MLAAAVFVVAGALVAEAETPARAPAESQASPALRCPIPAAFRRAFVRAARETAVPLALLTAMAHKESEMNPRAVSDMGAQGLLQLMPTTARELGADPTVPAENVRAGARYLARLLDRFGGDLNLALAAYNAGPTAVLRAGGPPGIETVDYILDVRSLADRLAGCR